MESPGMYADVTPASHPRPSSSSTSVEGRRGSAGDHAQLSSVHSANSAGSSAHPSPLPTRTNTLDVDDSSSVSSNDALHHRVQLKSGLSSPRSSVSGSSAARRGAWRVMGGGKSSRSYAKAPKSSTDHSPSSSSLGREDGTRAASPEASDVLGFEADYLIGPTDDDGDDGVRERAASSAAWERARLPGLTPPARVSYLPALSQSSASTEETRSISTDSKTASTLASSADAVPLLRNADAATQPTGPYDWANFVFAYSRGRWNPGATPKPPSQSTIHVGASVKIVHMQDVAALGPDRLAKPHRPSLEYIMPLSSENVEAVSTGLLPSLEPHSFTSKNQWSDDGEQATSKSSPEPSERSVESLPERLAIPSLGSISTADLAQQQQSQLYAAMHDPSSSTSAIMQLPGANQQPSPDAPTEHAPVRAQTAPQGQVLTGKLDNPSPPRAAMRPDPSVWDTPKLRKESVKSAGAGQSEHPPSLDAVATIASPPPSSSVAQPHPHMQAQSRPAFGAQISHLQLGPAVAAAPRPVARRGPASRQAAATPTQQSKSQGEDPTTPTRPGPTPVQASSSAAPAAWQSAPDGLSLPTDTAARQMQAATTSAAAAGSVYAIDLSAEHGTVAGLRRAARRTSIERAEAGQERRPKAEHLKNGPVPHSASFPGSSPRSTPRAADGLPIVPHLSSVGGGVASSSGGGGGGGGGRGQDQSHGYGPATSGGASVISVAHYFQGKPTGETRIDLRGNVSSPPNMIASLATDGPETSPNLRKENSVATASRSRPTLGSKTTSQRINAYLAAGKRAEKFYVEHGYLPFILPPNEESRLHALYRYGPPKIAGDPNFERIAHLVKLVFNSKLVLITLVGENEQTFQTEMGGGGEVTVASLQSTAGSRNCSFCSHAILQDNDEPMVILDTAKDWRFAGNPLVQGTPNIRFYAGCPLRTQDGHNIGSLCLIDDRPRAEFGPRQRHTLKEFARVVMREMELLRDKIHLRMRDRMQKSIELFSKECLEMDSEESEGDSASTPQASTGTQRVFHQAAESLRNALQITGAVIFDLSHFELMDSYDGDFVPGDLGSSATGSKVYFSNPVQPSLAMPDKDEGDKTPGRKAQQKTGITGIDGTTGFETFSPLASPSDGSVSGRVVPPMSVLGASELVSAPAERMESVPLAHHVKVAEFLRINKTGRYYPFAPPPFRSLLPSGVTSLLLVPIFGLNKQPFALLCAYSTASAHGPALEEIQGIGLQYLRAMGMIVLSAVLKKDIMLADKAKSHFISNISHELRTPLHGILAAAELLAETKLNATQGSYLETLEACGKSLLELVNHVLDFTKLSGNSRSGQKHVYTKTKCDMVKLIQEVCESSWIGQMAKQLESAQSGIGSVYAPPKDNNTAPVVTSASTLQAKAKHAQSNKVETVIDISMRPTGWLVNCDTGGIRRVLMNLIGNSLKFTVSGYVHVSLREVQSSDTHVLIELSVIDTGRGISRTFLEEQLFHPFTQENPLGTGTGLGLSIVNSIVQSPALNGKIDVWSTEGQGTEIRVTCELELCDDEDAEGPIYRPAVNVHKQRSVALLGFGNSRGDEDLRAAIEGYFYNWWEFTLVEQDDPRRFKYGDLVLVNDSLEVMEQVVRDRAGGLPPIVFLTGGRGDPEIAAACEAYHSAGGVARILFKPAGPSKLESVIDFCLQCLDRKRSGDPPCADETKPSTPLPSPSQSPAARANVENGDTYFFPAQARTDVRPTLGQSFPSFDSQSSELTPKAETSMSLRKRDGDGDGDGDADGFAVPKPYHMSPGPPGPSTSLIRRHSTEDKVVRQRIEGTDTCPDTGTTGCSKPSRPLLPARSITYHEPRLHKHVLMSPMSGAVGTKRPEGENDSYFDRSPAAPSSPNTPGSIISLEGGDGAVLRSVVSSPTPRSVSGGQKRRLQILSVEDNAINRRVIAAFLAKMEVDYIEAANGEEGVRQFELHPPNHFDVILMDLSMPVLDGLAATAAIRKIEHDRYMRATETSAASSSASSSSSSSRVPSEGSLKTSRAAAPPQRPNPRNRVKIFALTGRSTDEDKRRAFQTGADGYIVKPLSFKVLSSLLRMLPR
ncbi:hypothetical protein ACQY0O_003497 [Thecaphora frezii]